METPQAQEKKILVFVMDRTGDTRAELTIAEAERVARRELGNGKWLRLLTGGGTSEIIRNLSDLETRLNDTQRRLFENVDEVTLMAALVGGHRVTLLASV
jgi:hypothetical protein